MEAISSSNSSPSSAKFRWTITNFSQFTERRYLSDSFIAGPFNWRINLYPNGLDYSISDYLSIYLMVDGVAAFPTGWSIDAEYTLTLVNQFDNQINSTIEKGERTIFSAYEGDSQGFPDKIRQADLHDTTKRYLVNDTLIVEAHVIVHNFSIAHPPPQPQFDESSLRTNTAIETDKSDPFGFYLNSEQEKSDHELQKKLGTHIWNKKLLDNLVKVEEKLNKKIEQITCRMTKLVDKRKVDETQEKKQLSEE